MNGYTINEENNTIQIRGEICSEMEFSHRIYGEGFYNFNVKCNRLSGKADVLPITISERILNINNLKIGDEISAIGQIRSYNSVEEKKNRLLLTIFIREIIEDDKKEENSVFLNGYICKPPVYRTTPFGREIADVLLAVNRAYNKSDYIPCIFWGRNAKYISGLHTGDNIIIWGRMQSRIYQKKNEDMVEERTAYEVSVSRIELGNDQVEH